MNYEADNTYMKCIASKERPPRVRVVLGSIPGRVISNTLKMVVMAALLGIQGCGVSITTDLLF